MGGNGISKVDAYQTWAMKLLYLSSEKGFLPSFDHGFSFGLNSLVSEQGKPVMIMAADMRSQDSPKLPTKLK